MVYNKKRGNCEAWAVVVWCVVFIMLDVGEKEEGKEKEVESITII